MVDSLTPDPYRIQNNTTKYNALNAMQYPYLYGPMTEIPEVGNLIDRELNNMQNYALAYPISGKSVININPHELYPGSTVINSDTGIGKAVETTVQITPDSPQIPAQFYIGNTDLSLGSNRFVELGSCGAESEDGCAGQPRSVYLRNIPTGQIPLFGNVSIDSLTGCSGGFTAGRGTIPGMLEDISELAPTNFVANLTGDGNFGGSKCVRLKLPVGSHIYDPDMKCKLNYNDINKEGSLNGRLQITHSQVENNCPTSYVNGANVPNLSPQLSKTWWFEERCTPSFETAVPIIDIAVDPDPQNGETNLIPVAEPLFNPGSVQPIPGIKEPFRTNISNTPTPIKQGRCLTRTSAVLPTILIMSLLFCIIMSFIIIKIMYPC